MHFQQFCFRWYHTTYVVLIVFVEKTCFFLFRLRVDQEQYVESWCVFETGNPNRILQPNNNNNNAGIQFTHTLIHSRNRKPKTKKKKIAHTKQKQKWMSWILYFCFVSKKCETIFILVIPPRNRRSLICFFYLLPSIHPNVPVQTMQFYCSSNKNYIRAHTHTVEWREFLQYVEEENIYYKWEKEIKYVRIKEKQRMRQQKKTKGKRWDK